MFILDTNILSEARRARKRRASPELLEWLASVPLLQVYISAITLFELKQGVLLAARSDPPKAAALNSWLVGSVLRAFGDRVLPVDAEVATAAAELHVPNPASFRDSLIGATAIVHQMSIVTRNVHDFERFKGVQVINP